MIYLLDTDTFIFLLRGMKLAAPKDERERQRHRIARRIEARCRKRQAAGDAVGLSAITVAELEYGAQNSGDYAREIGGVRKTLTPFQTWDFDATAGAEHYGAVRHALEKAGIPIGAMDLLLAAQARALGATFVTNNTSHFARVTELACENWAAE